MKKTILIFATALIAAGCTKDQQFDDNAGPIEIHHEEKAQADDDRTRYILQSATQADFGGYIYMPEYNDLEETEYTLDIDSTYFVFLKESMSTYVGTILKHGGAVETGRQFKPDTGVKAGGFTMQSEKTYTIDKFDDYFVIYTYDEYFQNFTYKKIE